MPHPHLSRLVVLAAALTAAFASACAAADPLADGVISDEELLHAADEAAQCITDAGFEPDGPRPGAGDIGYVVGVWTQQVPTPEEADEIDAVLSSCWTEHVGDIEATYYEGLVLHGAQREADYAEMIQCLDRAGVHSVQVGDPETVVGDAVAGNDEAIMCLQAHLVPLFGTTLTM